MDDDHVTGFHVFDARTPHDIAVRRLPSLEGIILLEHGIQMSDEEELAFTDYGRLIHSGSNPRASSSARRTAPTCPTPS
jgi:hypothetical protein